MFDFFNLSSKAYARRAETMLLDILSGLTPGDSYC
jgi:hypothetical protein